MPLQKPFDPVQKPMPGHGYRDPDEQKKHDQKQFSALMVFMFWLLVGFVVVSAIGAIDRRNETSTENKKSPGYIFQLLKKQSKETVNPISNSQKDYDCHHALVVYADCQGQICHYAVQGRLRTFVGSNQTIRPGMVLDVCNW